MSKEDKEPIGKPNGLSDSDLAKLMALSPEKLREIINNIEQPHLRSIGEDELEPRNAGNTDEGPSFPSNNSGIDERRSQLPKEGDIYSFLNEGKLVQYQITKLVEQELNFTKYEAIAKGWADNMELTVHFWNQGDASEILTRDGNKLLDILSQLKHENVVRLFGYHSISTPEGSGILVVQERCAGGTLEELVFPGPRAVRQIASFSRQILSGVSFLLDKVEIPTSMLDPECILILEDKHSPPKTIKLNILQPQILAFKDPLLRPSTGPTNDLFTINRSFGMLLYRMAVGKLPSKLGSVNSAAARTGTSNQNSISEMFPRITEHFQSSTTNLSSSSNPHVAKPSISLMDFPISQKGNVTDVFPQLVEEFNESPQADSRQGDQQLLHSCMGKWAELFNFNGMNANSPSDFVAEYLAKISRLTQPTAELDKTSLKEAVAKNMDKINAERRRSGLPSIDSMYQVLSSVPGLLNHQSAPAPAALEEINDFAKNILQPTFDSISEFLSDQNIVPEIPTTVPLDLRKFIGKTFLKDPIVSIDQLRNDPFLQKWGESLKRLPINVYEFDHNGYPVQYEVVKHLGQGGFGSVAQGFVKTEHWEYNRRIAVKKLTKYVDESDESLAIQAKFDESMKQICMLDHKHVARYYGTHLRFPANDVEAAELVIIMEFCQGETLHKFIEDHGCFEEKITIANAYQILQGLAYLHMKKVVHRDIKPLNIMFKDEKQLTLKICDVDDSIIMSSNVTTKGVQQSMVSVPYVSPEMAKLHISGNAKEIIVGKGTDIWSFGCVILKMVSDSLEKYIRVIEEYMRDEVINIGNKTSANYLGAKNMPNEGHIHRVLEGIAAGNRPEIPGSLSEELRAFIGKCLIVERDDRPSADQLLKDPVFKGLSVFSDMELD